MSNFLAARSQMAISLGFHIIFAAVGMAMPLLMSLAEWQSLRTNDAKARELAQRWAKGTAVFFAVGAVSGTVLSFELGLLWPEFMRFSGAVIGMPLSLEGFAFFLEAIFLGIYLYGWDRVPARLHLACGFLVLLCGVASAFFVVTANAWMNTPSGFVLEHGVPTHIQVSAAILNPAAWSEGLHMIFAAFTAVGFAVAGVHAALILFRGPNAFDVRALRLSVIMGGVSALLQLLSGDYAAKVVARTQPVKFAAMESRWESGPNAPLTLLGWPDEEHEVTRYGVEIPGLLSWMTEGTTEANVAGLKAVPVRDRPNVGVVHVAFQLMVGCGCALCLLACVAAALAWRKRSWANERWFLWALVAGAPLGFFAIEAGWVVTEVGRQPWIVQNIFRTEAALTPVPHLVVPLVCFSVLYIFLGITVSVLFAKLVFSDLPVALPQAEPEVRPAPGLAAAHVEATLLTGR